MSDKDENAVAVSQAFASVQQALERLFGLLSQVQRHAPWNGCTQCDDTAMYIAAALDDKAAYLRGQDEGAAGVVRALNKVLDGPPDLDPSFGDEELNALARRIQSLRPVRRVAPPQMNDRLRAYLTKEELEAMDSVFGGGAKHDEIVLSMFREVAYERMSRESV